MVGVIVISVWGACFRFPAVWELLGIGEANRPFLDLYGLLAAGERAQAGFDAYQINPLDPYLRPSLYTEWWLLTGEMGLKRTDTYWLGILLLAVTLSVALLVLKPSNGREARLALLVLASPALLMAAHRANNDLVAFAVIGAALMLLRDRILIKRTLGIVLLAISAALKYYPLAAVIAFLYARTRRELVVWSAIYSLVLLLAWPSLAAGLGNAHKYMPNPEWLYAFGAPVLARDFQLSAPWFWFIPSCLVLIWAFATARRATMPETPDETEQAQRREFTVGSALLVGCFFLGASYVYKLVFSLWLLPWLWRAQLPQTEDRWRKATWWLLLAVLWMEGLLALLINAVIAPVAHQAAIALLYAALVGGQLATWALVACLLRRLFAETLMRVTFLCRREAFKMGN